MRLCTLLAALVGLNVALFAAEGFQLRPGDEVELTVTSGARALLLHQRLVIASDSFLYLPAGGRVTVAARTLDQIRADITTESKRAYHLKRDPQVELVIRKTATHVADSVSVLGAVQLPGVYTHEAGMTLKTAVAQAGGFATKVAIQEVQLIRGDQVTAMTPAEALSGKLANTLLQAGDLVVASEVSRPVTVFGVVMKPGPVEWFDGMRVSEAVALAGGFESAMQSTDGKSEPVQADVSNIKLYHGNVETTVNLASLFTPEAPAAPVPAVQPGDLIYVPPLKGRCTVVGAVEHPGSFALRREDRFLDMLGRAGLSLELADREGEAVIRRAGGEVLTVPLRPLLIDGNAQYNHAVRAGDLIVIPFVGVVGVAGEVRRPGLFPLKDRGGVYTFITLAGGPTERADLQNVAILRDGRPLSEKISIDYLKTSPAAVALALKSGDVIVVPPLDGVFVIGAVNFPGVVPHRPGMTLLEALGLAKGMSPQADAHKVAVMRTQGTRVVRLSPDVDALLNKNDRSQNVVLLPGDSVIVPFRAAKQDLLNLVTPFTYMLPFLIRR